MSYSYLVDPNNQFMTKSGTINVGGHIRVYLAATDDAAVTYKDFNGTVNPQDIILDDNGRAVIIADSSVAYRIEVYDRYNMLLWTQTPVWCMAAGGGVSNVRVQSTDGTVSVIRTTEGGTVVYDLSTQVEKEPAPYGTASLSESGVYATGEDFVALPWSTFGGDLTVQDQAFEIPFDAIADVDCDVVVTYDQSLPKNSIFVRMEVEYGSEAFSLPTRELDMSQDCPSVHFSFKVPVHKGETLTYKLYYQCDESVSCGIDARSWLNLEVNNLADSDSNNNYLTLINKPAINGVELVGDQSGSELHLQDKLTEGQYIHIDSASVISVSGLQPIGNYLSASESSKYYPTSNPSGFVTDDECQSSYLAISSFSSYSACVDSSITSISSFVSGLTGTYIEQSASSLFQPSGNYVSASDMSAYIPFSGLDKSEGKITAISGTALSAGKVYEGVNPVWVDNTADQIGVYNKTLAVDDTMTGYESGNSAVIGVNTAILSGYAKASSLEDYQLKSAMTAYASVEYVDGAVSGKLDVTASSQFLTSLPDDLAYTSDVASAVSGKLDASASSEFYPMTGNPSGFLTAHQSLDGYSTVEYVDSSVSGKLDATAYDSAQFILTSQSGMFQPSGYYQPSGEYLSATESSNYYSTSNPSGFITGVDLSPYQKTADMSAYQPSGDYQTAGNYLSSTDSAEFLLTSQSGLFQPSGNYQAAGNYLSATESSNYYPSSNPSGFITGVDLTPYQLTANMTGYIPVSALGTGEI